MPADKETAKEDALDVVPQSIHICKLHKIMFKDILRVKGDGEKGKEV